MRGGSALAQFQSGRRQGEDQPTRCAQPGKAAACRRTRPGLGAGRTSRGDAVSDAGARDGDAGFARQAPACFSLSAAAWKALSREQEDLDQGACGLDREPEAEHPQQRLVLEEDDVGDPSGAGAPSTARAGRRRSRSGIVICAGGHRIDGDARHGSGLGHDLLAEIGDLSRFRTPTELMASLGSCLRRIRPATPSSATDRRSRRPACPAHAGGVLVELSASAAGRTSQAAEGRCGAASSSRDRLEGAVPAVPPLSSADQERPLKTVAMVAIARELAGFIWVVVSRSLGRSCRGSPGLRGLARGAKRPRPSANQRALRRGSGPAKR